MNNKNIKSAALFIFFFFASSLLVLNYCLADSGEIASYNFNNLKSGADIFSNQSGDDLNGKIHGALAVGGISGTALYFNGVDSFAEVANSDKLNFDTGDFTLSVWVKTIATTIGNAEGRGDIIAKGDPYNSGYSLSSMNNRASSFEGNSGRSGFGGYCGAVPADPLDYNNFICPHDKFINDGVWHNLVSVRQGGLVKIYLDKQLVHQYQNADTVSTNDNLIIGRHGEKDEAFFRGKIDEIKIFNYALGQDQINSYYKNILEGYYSAAEARQDAALGFDYAKEFNPANDGNYVYTVKPGDTPWIISEKCGHGEWWKGVFNPSYFHDANRNSIIWAGDKIKLPASLCSSDYSVQKSEVQSSEVQSYVINKGDTLWSIAEKFCGTGFSWGKMFAGNSFSELNGNILIRYGETLNIDSNLCR